jgi:hypothetical protein
MSVIVQRITKNKIGRNSEESEGPADFFYRKKPFGCVLQCLKNSVMIVSIEFNRELYRQIRSFGAGSRGRGA